MKRIKLHKLCVKPLKSCYRTIHHLPILITKALHHLLLVDNMRKRGKRKKKKRERQHRMELGKQTKCRRDMVVVLEDKEKGEETWA